MHKISDVNNKLHLILTSTKTFIGDGTKFSALSFISAPPLAPHMSTAARLAKAASRREEHTGWDEASFGQSNSGCVPLHSVPKIQRPFPVLCCLHQNRLSVHHPPSSFLTLLPSLKIKCTAKNTPGDMGFGVPYWYNIPHLRFVLGPYLKGSVISHVTTWR